MLFGFQSNNYSKQYYHSTKYRYDNKEFKFINIFAIKYDTVIFFDAKKGCYVNYLKEKNYNFLNSTPIVIRNISEYGVAIYRIKNNNIYIVRNDGTEINTIIIHYDKYYVNK